MTGIVDTHVHLSFGEDLAMVERPHGAAEYEAQAADAGVVAAVVLAMAPSGDLEATRRFNDHVLGVRFDAIRAVPFCSVHPADGAAALEEVDRVAAAGARGLKLHPNTQRFDVADPAVGAVVERAGRHDLPVLFDAYSPGDPGQLMKFVELALAHMDVDLVLAHLGGTRFVDMVMFDALRTYDFWKPRLWFDISWTVPTFAGSPYAEQLLWVCRTLGTDRLLFGSDHPMVGVGPAVDGTRRLGFDDAELEAVLHGNAERLLRL